LTLASALRLLVITQCQLRHELLSHTPIVLEYFVRKASNPRIY
jgi:hypothetical protein